MGLQKLVYTHFNTSEPTRQVPDDTFQSNALGIMRIALLAAAGIGYQFFDARGKQLQC